MLVNPGEKHPVRLHYRPALRDLGRLTWRRWIRRHPVERETAQPRRCHLAGESWRSIRSAHFCKDGCPFMRISMIVFHQRNLEYPRSSSRPAMWPRRWAQLSRRQSAGEAASVPEEEQDRRPSIGDACEFGDAKQSRCSKCGCFGQWKTWLATQRCPIRKW